MNKHLKYIAAGSLLVSLVAASAAGQQVTKVGTTAAKFLSIPVGARALGIGGAFVGIANDASAMYWNPGGLAGLSQSEAVFSHTTWIADIGFSYVGVAIPLREWGVVGVNITAMTMDEMERTTEDFPEGTGQTFTAGSFAVGVTYAKKLTDWFYLGGNVKYINEHIWNSNATGLAIDLGTMFFTPFTGLKFGAGISNFGQKLKMSGDDLLTQKDISPIQGNNPNINASLSTDPFDLPLRLRIGVAYDVLASEDQHFTLAVDAAHPNDNSESIDVGGEYSLFKNTVAIRGGYKALGARDSEEEYTVGAGLRYDLAASLATRVDYAYQQFGRLGSIHTFSISIVF